jgi:hypothetical protein
LKYLKKTILLANTVVGRHKNMIVHYKLTLANMLNIHTKLLDLVQEGKITTDDFFILLSITKRIGKEKTAFPSIKTLMAETHFGKTKVQTCLGNLQVKGFLVREQRRVKNSAGKEVLSSNLYKIKTNLIGVYINTLDQELEEFCETVFEASENEASENQPISINQLGSINQLVEVEQPTKFEFFKANPYFEQNRIGLFPNLNESQIKVLYENFVRDYPKTKETTIYNYLAEQNKKLKPYENKFNNQTQPTANNHNQVSKFQSLDESREAFDKRIDILEEERGERFKRVYTEPNKPLPFPKPEFRNI